MKYRRIFTIVVDSFGIGAMPDADRFEDTGADTLGHIDQAAGPLNLPNLAGLGLGRLHPFRGGEAVQTRGHYGILQEASVGKDTMTGHWEMMGLHVTKPFQTFTENGFPEALIDALERETGHKVIGNRAASGTEILEVLGEEHIRTGAMIVYTSADSVLQIAASEETFGLEELYRCCEIARRLTLKPEWRVGRVIARPFVGMVPGQFKRTSNRHDYALSPSGPTALNALADQGFDVIGVGKIGDIFNGQGITRSLRSKSSVQGMTQAIGLTQEDFSGLCFVNLVDFDALWGHRRNPEGYARELEMFDEKLGIFLSGLKGDDLVMITADHGYDPTYRGTDHTREQVPLLCWSPSMKETGMMPVARTFAVIGATITDNFSVPMPENTIGKSILDDLK